MRSVALGFISKDEKWDYCIPNQSIERIEVKLEDETVWLNQEQMAILFKQTKQNISLHINNCYKENELDRNSTVKEYLTVQNEGRRKIRRKINYYNLDVVISVGYRVKSIQGTQFRILAKNGLLLPYWNRKVLVRY